jgi:hypothetical protein
MRDVPPALADMDSTRAYHAPGPAPGEKIVLQHYLVQKLSKHHTKDAAEWAIHRLVEQGMLTARCGRGDWPSALTEGKGTGPPPEGECYEVRALPYVLIESTLRLREWWGKLVVASKEEKPKPAKGRRDPKLEARDRWIYRQCCKGKMMPLDQIIAELKRIAREKGWEVIESPQGIRSAAARYAERHGLEAPPRRQDL